MSHCLWSSANYYNLLLHRQYTNCKSSLSPFRLFSNYQKHPTQLTADMSNFRPVSNLSFMSNVVERAVASQLTEYLSANGLLPCLYLPFPNILV